jgi:biotin carboxylase
MEQRLLILPGSYAAMNIVNKAHEMGIYTIVCDSFPNSPAKVIADESYMIDIFDVDSLTSLCIEKKINGVITGYLDSVLPCYCELCKRLDLPCYTTSELIELTLNKRKFKNICIENNISVITEYKLTSSFLEEDLKNIAYPIIIKPVDNQGSRGIYVCYNENELRKSYQKALDFSASKDILVEKYMDVPSVNMIYHLNNGDIYLDAMMDRRVNSQQKGFAKIAEALLFPSIYLQTYLKQANDDVIRMLKGYGFKNGVIFLQAFYDNGQFLIYEMGHRLPGSQTYKLVEKCCKYSPMEFLINFALTGVMYGNENKIKASPDFFNKKAVILICLLHEGVIGTIKGFELIKEIPEVISIDQKLFQGDSVQLIGTMQQILARIHIVADDNNTIKSVIERIHSFLEVIDINGNDQLMKLYDASDLV